MVTETTPFPDTLRWSERALNPNQHVKYNQLIYATNNNSTMFIGSKYEKVNCTAILHKKHTTPPPQPTNQCHPILSNFVIVNKLVHQSLLTVSKYTKLMKINVNSKFRACKQFTASGEHMWQFMNEISIQTSCNWVYTCTRSNYRPFLINEPIIIQFSFHPLWSLMLCFCGHTYFASLDLYREPK